MGPNYLMKEHTYKCPIDDTDLPVSAGSKKYCIQCHHFGGLTQSPKEDAIFHPEFDKEIRVRGCFLYCKLGDFFVPFVSPRQTKQAIKVSQ